MTSEICFWFGEHLGRILITHVTDLPILPQYVPSGCVEEKYNVYIPYDVLLTPSCDCVIDLNFSVTFQSGVEAALFLYEIPGQPGFTSYFSLTSERNIVVVYKGYNIHEPMALRKGCCIGFITLTAYRF